MSLLERFSIEKGNGTVNAWDSLYVDDVFYKSDNYEARNEMKTFHQDCQRKAQVWLHSMM